MEGRQLRVKSGGLWILHMCFEFILHRVKRHGRTVSRGRQTTVVPMAVIQSWCSSGHFTHLPWRLLERTSKQQQVIGATGGFQQAGRSG